MALSAELSRCLRQQTLEFGCVRSMAGTACSLGEWRMDNRIAAIGEHGLMASSTQFVWIVCQQRLDCRPVGIVALRAISGLDWQMHAAQAQPLIDIAVTIGAQLRFLALHKFRLEGTMRQVTIGTNPINKWCVCARRGRKRLKITVAIQAECIGFLGEKMLLCLAVC